MFLFFASSYSSSAIDLEFPVCDPYNIVSPLKLSAEELRFLLFVKYNHSALTIHLMINL